MLSQVSSLRHFSFKRRTIYPRHVRSLACLRETGKDSHPYFREKPQGNRQAPPRASQSLLELRELNSALIACMIVLTLRNSQSRASVTEKVFGWFADHLGLCIRNDAPALSWVCCRQKAHATHSCCSVSDCRDRTTMSAPWRR